MENETREVTYLAISLMLAALVLSFIVYGLSITRHVSGVRNDEISANQRIEQYREYNLYDGQSLYGDDVIELIRSKYDSGVDIFVDYRINASAGNAIVSSGSGTKCSYCNSISEYDHRFYNRKMYFAHIDASENTPNAYFALDANATGSTRYDLRNWFPTKNRYRAYLVYNNDNIKEYYDEMMLQYRASSASYSSEEGKLNLLDSLERPHNPSAQVTGIMLISFITLGIDS